MYPALFWVMVQGALIVQGQKGAKNVVVALSAPAEMLDAAREALATDPDQPVGKVDVVSIDVAPEASDDELRARLDGTDDSDSEIDLIVRVPESPSDESPVDVVFDSTASKSEIARERVESALARWRSNLRGRAAEERAIDPAALDPIVIDSHSVAEKKDQGALMLSLMLPILLIVMSVLGAFFPAVDLTAGEKERHTAETTMLLPVPRTSVHLGKILAVCASAMIALTLNILALGLAAGHLLDQLSGIAGESILVQFPVGAMLEVLPLALLFAFFVSAALTGFASLAASFKEGQALLGPVQMLFIFPAMAAGLPGLTLTAATAWIPVVNVALAFRALLVGDATAIGLAMCALSLTVYAALAIWFSVRLRSNERVALAGETLSARGLVGLLRPQRNRA